MQLHVLLTTWEGPPPYQVLSEDSEDEAKKLRECLESCFRRRPEERPSATELSASAFLAEEDQLEESRWDESGSFDRLSSTMEDLKRQMERVVVSKLSSNDLAISAPKETDGGSTTTEIEAQIMRRKKYGEAAPKYVLPPSCLRHPLRF